MNKPTQQQVIEAYKKLPPPVRDFLADPDQLARVLTDIKNTYDLHIDIIGQVNEAIGYLLLGLMNPSEFKETLRIAGISDDVTANITAEINKRIFVPLRAQMEKGGTSVPPSESAPVKPTSVGVPSYGAPSVPRTAPVMPRASSYAPPPQSPSYPSQRQEAESPLVRRVPQPSTPSTPSISVIAPPVQRASVPVPSAAPATFVPPRPQPTPPAPRPTPPPNLPGTFPQPVPTTPPTPQPPAPYSADPYRESFD